MEGSTRISDLPDNITMTSAGPMATTGGNPSTSYSPDLDSHSGHGPGGSSPVISGYAPLNSHPNPYGQGPPSQMPPPQQTKINANGSQNSNPYLNMGGGGSLGMGGEANLAGPHAHLPNMPQYPLPQRDIPMDISGYMQDETIQPNYIPPFSSGGGGDNKYVESQEERIKRQRKLKRGKLFSGNWTLDDIIAELQQPIIVAMLFFIFQSPYIHSSMAKYLSFMKLFEEDGNINTSGILTKSVLFGLCYFAWARFVEYLDV